MTHSSVIGLVVLHVAHSAFSIMQSCLLKIVRWIDIVGTIEGFEVSNPGQVCSCKQVGLKNALLHGG